MPKIYLGLLFLFSLTLLGAKDYHKEVPKAWKTSNINKAAIALYGEEKFSHIKKSLNIELFVPKALVRDETHVPIRVRTNIPAKSIAIFQNANEAALVAVFYINNFEKTDIEIPIVMEKKGTVFAVIESMSGVLYYKRAFVDVVCLPCMAQGK